MGELVSLVPTGSSLVPTAVVSSVPAEVLRALAAVLEAVSGADELFEEYCFLPPVVRLLRLGAASGFDGSFEAVVLSLLLGPAVSV